MRSGLIAIKKAKFDMPLPFCQKVLDAYPVAFGYASAQVEDGKHYLDIKHFDGAEVVLSSALEKVQKAYHDDEVIFHFQNAEEHEITVESLQPFIILGEGDDVTGALVMEGEFLSYGKENEKSDAGDLIPQHSPEYYAVQEYLKEKIEFLYEQCGKDMAKLLTLLDSPLVRKEIKPMLIPRGNILFIPAKGLCIPYAEVAPPLGQDFPWGYVTRTLGYTEGKAEPEKAPDPPTGKRATKFDMPEKKDAPVTDPPPVAVPPKPAAAPSAAPPPAAPTADAGKKIEPIDLGAKAKMVVMQGVPRILPKGGMNWKEQKSWWHIHTDLARPKDSVELMLGFPVADLKEGSVYIEMLTKAEAELRKSPAKDMGKAVDQEAARTAAAPAGFQVIPPESRKKTLEMVDKGNDLRYSDAQVSPAQIQQLEFAQPGFTKQHQLPISLVLTWTQTTYENLDHKALAVLASELRFLVIKHAPQLLKKPEAPAAAAAPPAAADGKRIPLSQRAKMKA